MSYPLPLSTPGTFLKTAPQAPNQAKFACQEHVFALAGFFANRLWYFGYPIYACSARCQTKAVLFGIVVEHYDR